jgi:hypothetical protein
MTNLFCVPRENREKMTESLGDLEDPVDKVWKM